MNDRKLRIARRAARELKDGHVVNLGVGLPVLVADVLPPGLRVFLHSENGILGLGPTPPEGEGDPDLVNASKQPVTVLPGASFFDSAAAFAMIRGGHVDVAVLGALEVSQEGDIANWTVPGGSQLGVGGAMDLVVGARRVVVTMLHQSRDGSSKVLPACTLPITARRQADLLITDLAVFSFDNGEMTLEELAPEVSLEQLRAVTPARFRVRQPLGVYGTAPEAAAADSE